MAVCGRCFVCGSKLECGGHPRCGEPHKICAGCLDAMHALGGLNEHESGVLITLIDAASERGVTMSEEAKIYSWLIVAGLLMMVVAVLWNRSACYSRWERSGRQADWGLVQGCLVEEGGVWIPDGNLRELTP